MSSGCGDVLSLEDLKTAKKHQTFEAEVITGRAGGISFGAEIDFATNQVTGQVQKTLPAILRDMGFDPASFDFTTGGTVNARDTVVYNPADNNWYSWAGVLPHVVAPGTDPTADSNWKPRTDQLLRQEMASPTGLNLSWSGGAPANIIIIRSIFQFMTAADVTAITTNIAARIDVDYALQAAVDAGVTHLFYNPAKGRYVHGGTVTLPVCFNISGYSRKPYTVSGDSSFNNCGSVIQLKSGALGLFKMVGRHNIEGIVFDGLDKSVGFVYADSQVSGNRFINCGFYRWLYGVGRTSGYLATVHIRGCNISGNVDGVRNLIDSTVSHSVINANDRNGVNLQAGANNNTFSQVRVEWNSEAGILANGAIQNIFSDELIDRNGLEGVVDLGGSNWKLVNAPIRRNGRLANAGSTSNCNMRVEGSGSAAQLANIEMLRGADDDGGGTVTPEYGIIYTGGSTNMSVSIVNCNLARSGTLGVLRSVVTPATLKYYGNVGLSDVSTEGLAQIISGRHKLGPTTSNARIPAGGTLNFNVTVLDSALGTYARPKSAILEFHTRNETHVVSEVYKLEVMISRPGTAAATIITLAPVPGSSSSWGLASASPTGVIVSNLTTADNGLTISGTLTGIDSSARFTDISAKG